MLLPPPVSVGQKATCAYKRRRSDEIRRWAFAAIGGGQGSEITVADVHVGCGWHHIHTVLAKVRFVHHVRAASVGSEATN
jgi:hypothetical protein